MTSPAPSLTLAGILAGIILTLATPVSGTAQPPPGPPGPTKPLIVNPCAQTIAPGSFNRWLSRRLRAQRQLGYGKRPHFAGRPVSVCRWRAVVQKTRRVERRVARWRRACLNGSPSANRCLGRHLSRSYGWHRNPQWSCLDSLWGHYESGWDRRADNPTSDAYGIPQALPGSKMGRGWRDSAKVQITWGLGYIRNRYTTPCGALAARVAQGWY